MNQSDEPLRKKLNQELFHIAHLLNDDDYSDVSDAVDDMFVHIDGYTKALFIELIKSDSDAFNGSDHQEDITDYANELIVKVEAL